MSNAFQAAQHRKARPEQEIFDDLATVCATPGFIHVIAALCFRDNVVRYKGKMTPEDYAKLFSPDRLIRTELSTLIGLAARTEIDRQLPKLDALQDLQNRTETLLREVHETMLEPFKSAIRANLEAAETQQRSVEGEPIGNAVNADPFESATAMREPIFYGPDSAYSFQYREFSTKKYSSDEKWLQDNKGFSVKDAARAVEAIGIKQDQKLLEWVRGLKDIPEAERTFLPGFTLSASEIATSSDLSIDAVRKILDAFSYASDGNPTFKSLSDFSATNALPILKFTPDEYVVLQYASLADALYDTPFYWMAADTRYSSTAMKNRGQFTESFSSERIEKVFGKSNVHRNIDIWRSADEKLAEIDTLVLYGGRAIVLQAKSKKLTIDARKGNDLQLRKDFQSAIQDAYNQALLCSEQIQRPTLRFTDANGTEIKIPNHIKKIHPVCIVSDHYPALSFQARQFLKTTISDVILAPLISDVFALDTMTELLDTPLRLLSYLELRAAAADNVIASHENAVLGFHLRKNLWLGDYNMIQLGDDISTDVDIAMMARRTNVDGEKVPPGILTFLEGKSIGRVVKELESKSDHPWPIEVGLELLKIGSDTANDLSSAIDRITSETRKDGMQHDITMSFGKAGSGITVHCTSAETLVAAPKLRRHCELRKYSVKAARWYGIALSKEATVRFTMHLEYPFLYNEPLETATRAMPKAQPPSSLRNFGKALLPPPGRNDPCTCGSGRRYRKCCGKGLLSR
jgi:hypothetical protein